MSASRESRTQKIQKALWLLSLAGFLLFFSFQIRYSAKLPFIGHDQNAFWLMPPAPITMGGYRLDPDRPPSVSYEKVFMAAEGSGEVHFFLKAMRRARVFLNGVEFSWPGELNNWKKMTARNVSGYLKPGKNSLRVDVTNATGPPLLYFYSRGLDEDIRSDDSWDAVFSGEALGKALIARDSTLFPSGPALPGPMAELRKNHPLLIFVFVFGGVVFISGRFLNCPGRRFLKPAVIFLGILLVWVFLFGRNILKGPLEVGFDANEHLDYVRYLLANHRLPQAFEGWAMYHPPLYYWTAALTAALLNRGFAAEVPLEGIKWINFAGGAGHVVVCFFLGRVLFPRDRKRQMLTLSFAAAIPMNVYMSAYVSNEPLHAFWGGLMILTVVKVLLKPRVLPRDGVVTGVLLGLMLLTKMTALVIMPVVLLTVSMKILEEREKRFPRVLRANGWILLSVLILTGWYYLRNLMTAGTLFPVNWTEDGWWQHPGFRTWDYYLSFGRVFAQPFFAGFSSWADGFYATFWGDGFLAGRAGIPKPESWDYRFMAVTYLMAIPATIMIFGGFLRCVWESFRERDPGRSLALFFLTFLAWVLMAALIYLNLQRAAWPNGKAFFALSLLGPFSVFAASGMDACDRLLAKKDILLSLRTLLWGWFAAFLFVIVKTYGF